MRQGRASGCKDTSKQLYASPGPGRIVVVDASGQRINDSYRYWSECQVRRLRRGGRGEGGRAGSILAAVALEEEARVLLLLFRVSVHAHDALDVARAERVQQRVVVEPRPRSREEVRVEQI